MDAGDEARKGPLAAEDIAQLAAAMERAGQIRKAVGMAAVNGWVLGAGAALSAPFAPFGPVAFFMFIALALLSWNEFRGRKLLQAFDEAGPELLWKNQLGLMIVVVIYCAWGIRSASGGAVSESVAEVEMMFPDITSLISDLVAAFYGVVALATVLAQGAMMRFYHNRIALVREYLAETPEWTVEVVRVVQGGGARSGGS